MQPLPTPEDVRCAAGQDFSPQQISLWRAKLIDESWLGLQHFSIYIYTREQLLNAKLNELGDVRRY